MHVPAGNPIKFGLGLVSIGFDVVFILQHYVWFRPPQQQQQAADYIAAAHKLGEQQHQHAQHQQQEHEQQEHHVVLATVSDDAAEARPLLLPVSASISQVQ